MREERIDWPNGAKLALSIVINVEEGSEMAIAIVPYQLDDNDMKMWTDPAYTPAAWLDYARRCFDQLYREGVAGNPKMMSLGLHLRIIGRPGRIWALEAFLNHARAHDGVWFAARQEIAEALAAAEPA